MRVGARGRFGASFLSLVLAGLMLASLARAQQPVALRVDGSVPAALEQRLVSAIAGQLVGLATRGAPGAVQVSQRANGLELSFFDGAGSARGVRRIDVGSHELVAVEAASMVRAFVLALAEEGEAARAEEDLAERPPSPPTEAAAEAAAEEPAPAVEAPPVVPARSPPALPNRPLDTIRRFQVSAFYTGSTYAKQLPWQSGVRAELSLRVSRALYAGLGYTFHPPITVRQQAASVRMRDHAPQLSVGLRLGTQRFRWGGEVLLGPVVTHRAVAAAADALVARDPSTRWSPLVAVRARLQLNVLARTWIDVAPALELAFGVPDAIVDPGARSVIISPRTVRARLDVGASFDLL